MKRFFLMAIAVITLLLLCSCDSEFSFRGSRFGDSMQQIIQAEGDDGETDEIGDYQSLRYEREIISGDKASLVYDFKDDKLSHITFLIHKENDAEANYSDMKKLFKKYGEPVKEEALEYRFYQALWKNDRYGIFLLVNKGDIIAICSSDPGKAEGFSRTYSYSYLFDDSESISDIGTPVVGPDFYNDPYEIESFIPVPKEGYEYTVRNSITEEELSVLKSKPTMQQLIAVFGYPPMAEIYKDYTTYNDEVKIVKQFYLQYIFDGNRLGVIFNEDCNLIKVSYDKSLAAIPDKNNENFEKPIGIVRNDITRDELAFIDEETTPEELQSILGAPHRECYNAQYFRRAGIDYIRFLMSQHFMYPLQDGGVLDVRYSSGNSSVLQVRTADIYEVNGEATELVEYEF